MKANQTNTSKRGGKGGGSGGGSGGRGGKSASKTAAKPTGKTAAKSAPNTAGQMSRKTLPGTNAPPTTGGVKKPRRYKPGSKIFLLCVLPLRY